MIGLDIGDTVTLDPAKQNNYSPPLTLEAAYDPLVTVGAWQLHDAAAFARDQVGAHAGRQGLAVLAAARTSSSSAAITLTAEDVKWTFDRIIAVKDQTAFYIGNVCRRQRRRPAHRRHHAQGAGRAHP